MPVQFNIDSRHDENARFKKVLFGFDGELLEVELNELQDIFNSRSGQLVDKLFGSRPFYTGTYGYASGTLTLTNELVAMNKELIFIPTASIAVASGETVYLNIQEKTVTQADTIKKYGLIPGSEVVTNYLQDSRKGEETTRRVQVTYQLTKTNVGTGTFLKLCSINASGQVVKTTSDYADSDLYKEIRRLASEVITSTGVWTSITQAKDDAIAWAKSFGLGAEAKDISNTDLNNLDATGFYRGAGLTNPPVAGSTGYYFIIHTKHDASFKSQIAIRYGTGSTTGQVYQRAQTASNTWSAWSTMETTAGAQAKADAVQTNLTTHAGSTTAHANATTSANGFMSSADKTKLDGVATGAEVNQNAFNTIAVSGQSSVVADTKTDTLTLVAGNATQITTDANTDTITIASANATTSVAGAMSATDKTKLDGIATGAEVNQNAFTTVVAGGTSVVADAKTDTLTIEAGNAVTVTGDATNDKVTIAVPNATTSANGAMSSADKTKLDGITPGAGVTQNAFSIVSAGGVNVQAEVPTDTLTIEGGTNVTVTGDATNDKVTIGLSSNVETTSGAQAKADQAEADAIAWVKSFGLGDVSKYLSAPNLDTLVTNGLYYVVNPTNLPTGAGNGSVLVQANSSTYVVQTYTVQSSGATHVRAMNNSVWGAWKQLATTDLATSALNGLMSSTDKSKLDGIATGANNYTHPATHPPSIIAQDASNRFVTDTEKSTWNGKASTAVATTSANGLMSSTDKSKLDGIASGAQPNQNAFSTVSANGTLLSADSTGDTLHVASGSGITITGDTSTDQMTIAVTNYANLETTSGAQTKADNALNDAKDYAMNMVSTGSTADPNTTTEAYILTNHANSPNPSMYWHILTFFYSTKTGNRAQLALQYNLTGTRVYTRNVFGGTWEPWRELASTAVATTALNGLMSSTDKTKLDGIATGANNYTHPATHPPSIIAQDASNRFVTDTEKSTWNGKASTAVATTSANGLMSSGDKSKLDGISASADVNQNAFSNVKVGTTTISADSVTDTLELVAGTNVVLTPDATNDKVTIALSSSVETTSGAQSKADSAEASAIAWAKGYGLGSNAQNLPAGSDLNVWRYSGWYRVNGPANAPFGTAGDTTRWWYVEYILHDSSWCLQRAFNFHDDHFYTRRLENGVWQDWFRAPNDRITFSKVSCTNTTTLTPSAWIRMPWTVADEDTDGIRQSNNTFIIPRSGFYRIYFKTIVSTDGSGGFQCQFWVINGNGAKHTVVDSLAGSAFHSYTGETVLYLNAGETWEYVVRTTATTNKTMYTTNGFLQYIGTRV